ncbi:MAG TPA: hypothetical protein PLP05_09255, partial [Sedimentisphaerales bacterium]|nr:hypothetical protein [Sedimentisphaerales bacterium]
MGLIKRIFKFGLFGILLIIIAVVLAIWMIGENLVKVGVETAATKTLGVDVSVKDIDISIFKGQLGMQGLVVCNPSGYDLKNLLELNKGNIQVTLKSLMQDTVKIDEIKLDGINLVLEQKGMTNNLQEILNNLKTETQPQPVEKGEKKGKNLEITNLEITNVKVSVKLIPIPGQTQTVDLTLSPIKMQNL